MSKRKESKSVLFTDEFLQYASISLSLNAYQMLHFGDNKCRASQNIDNISMHKEEHIINPPHSTLSPPKKIPRASCTHFLLVISHEISQENTTMIDH